jgi:hypothetical protein
MDPFAEELKDKLLEIVKDKGKEFWDSHADVRAGITDRLERFAELAKEYVTADEDTRKEIMQDMARVKNTTELLFDSIALDAIPAAKLAFKEIISTILDVAIKILPVVLGAI